jgi:two-component system, NtrC family, response regulator AtoC
MSAKNIQILVVEDNSVDAIRFKKALAEADQINFTIDDVETLSEAKDRLQEEEFDIVVLDLLLPDSKGIETLLQIKNLVQDLPIIIISGMEDEALAIEAVRKGAQDYLLKDRCDANLLSASINYAIERYRIPRELKQADESTPQALAQLREKEDLLRLVLGVMADGFWDWDIKTGLVKREASWPAILGYQLEDIDPDLASWKRLIYPHDLPRVMTAIKECLKGNADRYENEYRMKAKSGEWKWIQDYGQIIERDENGKALRAVGALRDITARKAAEKKSREIQKRLQVALEGGDLGWWEWNIQTEEGFADDRAAKILGYLPHEIGSPTKFWEESIHPDDRPTANKALTGYLRGEASSYEVEPRLRTKSGEWKWILVRGKIIEYDSEGKPLRMGGTYLDITEHKLAEETVRESEKRFRAIFEGAGDPIILKDRSLRYTQANPAFEKLVGLPSSEIMGKKYEDLFGEDPSNSITDIDRRVLSGETIEAERSTTIRGEPMRFVATRTPLRDASGEIVGILTMLHDISDRKHGQVSPILAGGKYRSQAMRSTINLASVAAEKESIVLLRGESGCGKDYLARYIHDNSKRSDGPYLCVNCAAIAPELAESELFGHEKGSFTGAVTQKRGLLELAEGGTLLLNEIGDLSLPLQAKLLTFLDDRKFTRVGGEKEITANARLMAATNKDLEREVEAGRFRKDLFYRINVMSINVPPLRERVDDIPILVEEILSQLQKEMQFHTLPSIDPTTMEMLKSYHWPGNVRELRNTLERSVILSDGGTIDLTCLQLSMGRGSHNKEWLFSTSFPFGGTLQDVTDELTKAVLAEALRLSGGNRAKTARTLGISRDSLYRYMKKFGMEMGN